MHTLTHMHMHTTDSCSPSTALAPPATFAALHCTALRRRPCPHPRPLPPCRPQHAPQGAVNYAAVARQEVHELAAHPPPVTLLPGHLTGVEEWDKVGVEGCVRA